MKLFSTLTDINKERALHMAEHIVLDVLLEDGLMGEPENAEEQERFEQIQEALTHAKTLETSDEQAEYLFENAATGELILEKAYQMATTAFFIEEDEQVFYIKEMNDHFDDDPLNSEDNESSSEDEKEFSSMITNSPKKDTKHLN